MREIILCFLFILVIFFVWLLTLKKTLSETNRRQNSEYRELKDRYYYVLERLGSLERTLNLRYRERPVIKEHEKITSENPEIGE